MNFRYLLLFPVLIFLLSSCKKDSGINPGPGNFQIAFGDGLPTTGRASVLSTSGEIFSIGSQFSPEKGIYSLYLQKCDKQGNLLWSKSFGGNYDCFGEDILLTTDGHLLLLGNANSPGAGLSDILLIKTDTDGNVIWQNTFGGTDNDFATKIKATGNNNYLVCGITESFGAGGQDAYLLRIDGLGNLIWQKTYGESLNDGLSDFLVMENGDLVLFGYTDNYGTVARDFWLVKTTAYGELIWQKTYGGSGYEEPQGISRSSDGNFVLAGHTASFGDIHHDALVIKVDPEGESIWQKTLGTPDNHEGAMNVWASQSGPVYVLARANHIDNAILYKLAPEGGLMDSKVFGGENHDILYGITEHDNSLYLTGFTESYSGHPDKKPNLFLVKTDK